MGLYSLENSASIPRVSGQVIVPDTCYLIALRILDHDYHDAVEHFHSQATNQKSEFFINVVIRQEQLRDARNRCLVGAIKGLIASNNSIETRYKSLNKFKDDQ